MVQAVLDRRWRLAIMAGFALAILGALAAPPAGAETTGKQAEVFIEGLAGSGIAMLEKGDYTDEERELEFRGIVRRGFALEAIGKFVVARHWRKMTPEQREEYIDLFSEWLLKTYANNLGGFRGQTLEIIKSAETESRYNDVVVSTRIVRVNGQPPINTDWRVRKFSEQFKIIDVVVEGASMVGTQRKEFDSVIQKVGVTGLIDNLRELLARVTGDTG